MKDNNNKLKIDKQQRIVVIVIKVPFIFLNYQGTYLFKFNHITLNLYYYHGKTYSGFNFKRPC